MDSDIQPQDVQVFIEVFLDIGDQLLTETDKRDIYDGGNQLHIFRLVYPLLKRVNHADRGALIKKAMEEGQGLYVQSYFLHALLEDVRKEAAECLMDTPDLEILKQVWLAKVDTQKPQLLSHPQLHSLLLCWQNWGKVDDVRTWSEEATCSDEGLLTFSGRFATFSHFNRAGDWSVNKRIRLSPKWLEDFLDPPTVISRLKILQDARQIPIAAAEYVDRFLKEVEMISEGKDPDSPWADD